ncbi:MAG: Lrp/AsnC family transcriptional regulator [Promethearchaeota archaeon]
MDNTDVKLLAAMEEDSRLSLKKLAKDLNVKTSTIYHRLHKLKESNIIERFTIVINPEEIGLKMHCLFNIHLKKMVIGKLDSMFLESFAKFLSEQFTEVLFSSVGDDNQIHIIASFKGKKHSEHFIKTLNDNPYIDNFDLIKFSSILKGKKIFSFIAKQYTFGEESELIKEKDHESDNLDSNDVSNEYSVQF